MPNDTAISERIWDMKYRLKAADGRPIDASIADSWHRVAKALAAVEAEPKVWARRFHGALQDFAFLPAGRILAGAGTEREVTLFNCFVMGEIADDMAGIFTSLREAALTMQKGGGIGYDFSTLRPRGAPVHGVGADASGPLSFMDVWDAMCRTIMSAGYRRGAMMATLRCDHPDIEAFVDAKREPGRLTMFNMSVLVTDAFMRAIERDEPWPLTFAGKTCRTVDARALWDRIMRSTYDHAEPGVIFIDRVNRLNNLAYCETIRSTNPCVTADTWVQTTQGPRQVGALVGKSFTALVDGTAHASGNAGFFCTGRKPVLRIVTEEGYSLRLTADHPVLRAASLSRYRIGKEWTAAGDLQPGDRIMLNDHRMAPEWPGAFGANEGYLIGLLVGDGTLKSDKAVLSVWRDRAAVNGVAPSIGADGVMHAALAAARTLPHRSDFAGWMDVPGRGEFRLSIAAVGRIARDLGMRPGDMAITPALEAASSAFYAGFLRGLFDADGSVQGSQQKGVSVRLAQSDLPRLQAVQRMLLRLGIAATIYAERRAAGESELPDGKGGTRRYAVRPQHELVIGRDNLQRFAERIGFADSDKRRRLRTQLAAYRREPNRERFMARVAVVEADGVEDVFDVQIPGVNAFDANGFVAHNCGEQPLPPYGACDLGSVNLAALVRDPFGKSARLDEKRLAKLVPLAVRMLDNVIDVSNFPLPQQAEEARAKRRIGLGVTGLGDALILCGLRYGSAEAVAAVEHWLGLLRRHAYLASTELAREKGSFPLFDRDQYLDGEFVATLDDDVRAAIAAHGMRNGLVTSIAPTGTISLVANNVSSGIEPVYAYSYTRTVLLPDGSRAEEAVTDYAYALYRQMHGPEAPLTPAFVDVAQLSPQEHVVMQAAAQRYIDSSISKTVNCPADISFAGFKDVYVQAYALGCKGCTTYRPNPVTGHVLSVEGALPAAAISEQQIEPAAAPPDDREVVYAAQPLARPQVLPGRTYKIKWPESDHALYITVNDVMQEGRRRPFEVFINSKNMEHYAWTVALTRMISAVFRRGGDVSFVVEELKAVFDPRGGQWVEGHYVPSLLAAIGEVIERHMIDIGFLPAPGKASKAKANAAAAGPTPRQCPKCGSAALIRQEGCDLCTACGYSKCA